MRIEPIQSVDNSTYWNYKRKNEIKKRKDKQRVYSEVENEIGNKGKYIDWRV